MQYLISPLNSIKINKNETDACEILQESRCHRKHRFQVINTDAKMWMLLNDYLLHFKIWSLENVPVWLQSHKSTKVFSQIEIIIIQ